MTILSRDTASNGALPQLENKRRLFIREKRNRFEHELGVRFIRIETDPGDERRVVVALGLGELAKLGKGCQ